MGILEFAQLAAAFGGGTLLPSIFRNGLKLFRADKARELTRIQSLEALVEALRRALDKVRLREDAIAQVLGVLIFALKHIEDLSPAIADALDRAIGILEAAQDRLSRIDAEGGAQ